MWKTVDINSFSNLSNLEVAYLKETSFGFIGHSWDSLHFFHLSIVYIIPD